MCGDRFREVFNRVVQAEKNDIDTAFLPVKIDRCESIWSPVELLEPVLVAWKSQLYVC